jgi:GNAT superfamily N-acetyltransferase
MSESIPFRGHIATGCDRAHRRFCRVLRQGRQPRSGDCASSHSRKLADHDPASERLWIAEVDGERAGCVFVVRSEQDAQAAQLRCLLVDANARGLGVGRKLVDECIRFSAAARYQRVVLWTNDVLVGARRIYEAAGFSLVSQLPHHSFGMDLVGQIWARPL